MNCKACLADIDESKVLGKKNDYNLMECQNCGTVIVSPFPTVEQLNEFYQSYFCSGMYISKEDKKVKRSKKRIKNIMKFATGKKFLDIGCNHGSTFMAAKELGLDAHGIDVDVEAVNECKNRFGEHHFNAVSAEVYASMGMKADIIYTSEVIEHVPDPDGFVHALYDILNKDGVLYLTTPDMGHFTLPKDKTKWEAVRPPEHIVYFTKKGIRALLERHGFKIEKIQFSLKPGIKLIARK